LGGSLAIAAGVVLWKRSERPKSAEPPTPALEAVEAEVRQAVIESRGRVIAKPSARSWGRYGMVLQAHALYSEADACFREAARLDDRDPHWPYYLGLNALLRDPSKALDFLRRARELNPPSADARTAVTLRLAEALVQSGELDEAERLFREEVAAHPSDPRVNYDLALVELARGNPRAAERHLQISVASPVTHKKSAACLATAYRQLGREDAAVRYDREASKAPEDSPLPDPYVDEYVELQVGIQGRLFEAERLDAEGRKAEAAQRLIALADSLPTCRTHMAAGVSLAELGDFAAAEQHFRACLNLDPAHTGANYFLATTLFYEAEGLKPGDANRARAKDLYRESARVMRTSLEKKPDNGLAHEFLGRDLFRLGETTEAIRHFREAIVCSPDIPEAHLDLAEALLADGKWDEAAKSVAAAEQLLPAGDPRLERLKKQLALKSKK
jgi:tetratricopeptide (TPR) repeat protein